MTLIHIFGQLRLRSASKADLDDLAEIATKSFPDDPEFDYRYPYRDQFPEDNWKWVRREYEEYLEQRDKFAVLVITTEVTSANGESREKPIALGVWDMKPTLPARGGDLGIDVRRDVNRAHYKQFYKTLAEAFDKYFGMYGEKQYHLWLLATLPDFRRRGAGTILTRWGMAKATENSYMTTVFGSPMGTKLYLHLGFIQTGTFVVQVEGDDAKLPIWSLEYRKDRSSNTPVPSNK